MTKRRKPRASLDTTPAATLYAADDQVERALGRVFAFALPIASVAGAIAAGALVSIGSALLVLAGGALLGAVAFFWASVRTLSGDSPLSRDFAMLGAARHAARQDHGALAEEKRRVLRALKDLENEHELGKIDDADYRSLVATYRDQAKAVMRKMDTEVAPFREEAERLASEHLKKHGISAATEPPPAPEKGNVSERPRMTCRQCHASNEADAAFCKRCGSPMSKESNRGQA
jgi:hypothetical protein